MSGRTQRKEAAAAATAGKWRQTNKALKKERASGKQDPNIESHIDKFFPFDFLSGNDVGKTLAGRVSDDISAILADPPSPCHRRVEKWQRRVAFIKKRDEFSCHNENEKLTRRNMMSGRTHFSFLIAFHAVDAATTSTSTTSAHYHLGQLSTNVAAIWQAW